MEDFTRKIKQLVYDRKYLTRRHHIENERIYREIQIADVEMALKNGKCDRVKPDTNSVYWRGSDVDGRALELILTLLDEAGEETLVIEDARQVKVGTAYEPGEDDQKVMADWLKNNPNYERIENGKGVRRKVEVVRKK